MILKDKDLNLQTEYPNADFTKIETLKQIVINKFTENGLNISKIRAGRLSKQDKGIYVYHSAGEIAYQNKRELVAEDDNSRTYRRYKKEYRYSFISTENLKEFESFLRMAIVESLNRKKYLKEENN